MSRKKKMIIAVCGIGLVFILVLLVIFNSDAAKVSRNLRLAQRHLLEEDYEQAIDAFEAAIEIDPRNTAAYIGLARAYAETENLEKAVKLLERRIRRGDSAEIQELLGRYAAELAEGETSQEVDSEAAAISPQPESGEPETIESAPPSPPEEPAVVVNTGFLSQGGELYYYDELGSPVVGWFEVGGSRYYAGAEGRLYRDGEYEIDSAKYLFDANGICLKEIGDEAWKQAYIDYIQDNHELWESDAGKCRYWLINIDDDEIPELFYQPFDSEDELAVYSDGALEVEWGDFSYIERGNLFRVFQCSYDSESFDIDKIYRLVDGKMTLIAEGLYLIDTVGDGQWSGEPMEELEYIKRWWWNGEMVTEAEYSVRLRKVYDETRVADIGYENSATYDQILDQIANY